MGWEVNKKSLDSLTLESFLTIELKLQITLWTVRIKEGPRSLQVIHLSIISGIQTLLYQTSGRPDTSSCEEDGLGEKWNSASLQRDADTVTKYLHQDCIIRRSHSSGFQTP